jgi:hypothetical protein
MPAPQPFDPDDIYCVYCHAVAAGLCAVCGAVCCADCVVLTMGLTTRRAICRSCDERGIRPAERRLFPWMAGLLLLSAAAALAVLLVTASYVATRATSG